MRMQVRTLASLSGLRIQRCCEVWCRLQTWLGSPVAVAQVGSCSSDSVPSLGTSICCRCGHKRQNKQRKNNNQKSPQKAQNPKQKKTWLFDFFFFFFGCSCMVGVLHIFWVLTLNQTRDLQIISPHSLGCFSGPCTCYLIDISQLTGQLYEATGSICFAHYSVPPESACWRRSWRGRDRQMTRHSAPGNQGFLAPPQSLECTFSPPFPRVGVSLEKATLTEKDAVETFWTGYVTIN